MPYEIVEVCPECDIAGCQHIRDRQALPAVKVKPLVWEQIGRSVHKSQHYTIHHFGPDGAVTSCIIDGPDGFLAYRSNLEAAKAAAQADYEARILSAVEATPAPTLAEAAKVLLDRINRPATGDVDPLWPDFLRLDQAALRRIAEGGE